MPTAGIKYPLFWRFFWVVILVANGVTLWFYQSLPFRQITEYEGTINQISAIDQKLPPNAILLFEENGPAVEMALPLWLAFDHSTFLIAPANKENPALSEAIQGWLDDDRVVYWVSSAPEGYNFPQNQGILGGYQWTSGWTTPYVLPAINEMPYIFGEKQFLFDFYRLSNSAAASKTVYTIPLYAGDPAFVLDGLYESEAREGKLPLRWTAGELVFDLPFPNTPDALVLMMGSPRPPGAPEAVVEIFVDGQLVGRQTPAVRPQLYVFDLSGISESENPPRVVVKSTTWTADDGERVAKRPLGIYIPWVKYVTRP